MDSMIVMIATTDTTTPVATLPLVVKPDEMSFAAELVAELEEMLFGAGDTDVEEMPRVADSKVNGVAVAFLTCISPVSLVVVDVAFGNAIKSVSMTFTCPAPPFEQLEKPRNEAKRAVTLDEKAVGSAVAGLVIDTSGEMLIAEPEVVTQTPTEL